MKIKNKNLQKNYFEIKAWKKSYFTCGIDEVGRGCLAGPLVVSAVILPKNKNHNFLKDSKILSQQKREKAFIWITQNCLFTTAITNHKKIDQINIYQATLVTMKKALLQILQLIPFTQEQIRYILIDSMPLDLSNNELYKNLKFYSFDKGESISCSIAAASIVAKVVRDRLLEKMEILMPQYNLKKNKGYATSNHVESLKNNGPTIIHRKSFIKNLLKEKINETKQQELF